GTDYLSRAEASGKFYLIRGLLHYVVLNIHRPLRVVEVSRHRVGLLLVKVTKLRNFTGAAHQQLLREFLSRLRVDGTQQYPVVGYIVTLQNDIVYRNLSPLVNTEVQIDGVIVNFGLHRIYRERKIAVVQV